MGCKILLKGGQTINGEAEPVIIGGMVLDIHAIPSMPANPRTTTPGKVFFLIPNFVFSLNLGSKSISIMSISY